MMNTLFFFINFVIGQSCFFLIILSGSINAAEIDIESFFDACADSETHTIASVLKDHPEYVKEVSEDGETCLMLSALGDDLDLVKLLIEAGSDVNQRAQGEDNHRMPVLGWHTLAGNVEIVSYLIKYAGADVNLDFDGVDEEGNRVGIFTLLDLIDFMMLQANKQSHMIEPEFVQEMEELLRHFTEIRSVLVEHGAKKFVGTEDL